MKICLIAEGCYPYLVGGVSSWIHQLITGLPEHEFTVVAINPDSSRRGQSLYERPANLKEIHDIFLDEFKHKPARRIRPIRFLPEERLLLLSMLDLKPIDWTECLDFFRQCRSRGCTSADLIASEIFYQGVSDIHQKKHAHLPFTDVYWTYRSMFALVFSLLTVDLPKADLYHSVSTGYAGLLGSMATNEHHTPFILTEHGIYTREREEEIIKADWVDGPLKSIWIDFFYFLSNLAYQSAEKVISLFARSQAIQKEIGCPHDKTHVIHNGIPIDQYAAIAHQVQLRPADAPVRIGAIVRIVPIKDIKTMLQAFALVIRRIPDAQFILLGPVDEDPDYYQECIQFIDFLQLSQVVFTGRVDVKDYLPSLDLLVLTSISEGQPLAILEGFASRLPVVTTNVGDCETLVQGEADGFGPAGRVAPVMDSVSLADAIVELASDPALRRRLGDNGYARVQQQYGQQALIDQYQTLYKQVQKGE